MKTRQAILELLQDPKVSKLNLYFWSIPVLALEEHKHSMKAVFKGSTDTPQGATL